MLNFVVCVYGLIILSVTERHTQRSFNIKPESIWYRGFNSNGAVFILEQVSISDTSFFWSRPRGRSRKLKI